MNDMKEIIVASTNPVKIKTTQEAFTQVFPEEEFAYRGINVPSDVSDQPMSDGETYTGAFNRATHAKETMADADYWVGIEGGCEDSKHGLEAFAWIVIYDKSDKPGKARTAAFILPDKIAGLVRDGMELGHADDQVFGVKNSKQKQGTVGTLTHGLIDRTDYYTHAAILALISFANPNLYDSK